MKSWRLVSNAPLEERKALQRLCREQAKLRLLKDIQNDLIVCKIEGWDYKEYLHELMQIIKHFLGD